MTCHFAGCPHCDAELKFRRQFAERRPTSEALANALANHRSWHEIVNDTLLDEAHVGQNAGDTRRPSGPYNAGKLHRFACHEHQTTWVVGSNLFSFWKEQTEAEQRELWREIEGYEDIAPGSASAQMSRHDR